MVGILGGVASGKSEVARQFGRLGAAVIDADRLGHGVLDDPEVVASLVNRWGPEICDESGALIRSKIAALVFGGDAASQRELEFLERETHPRIGTRIAHATKAARQAGTPLIILDAPVMIKAGWDRMCDHLVFVDVPRETRWQWAQIRGWTEQEFDDREQAQTPVEEKRRRASVIVDNSRSLEETFDQVNQLWQTYTNMRLSDATA